MRETKREYEVVVITSDGEELEGEMVEARSKRDAAGKVFGRMDCDGIQTIFVSDDEEHVQYQQVGRTLRAV